MPGDENCFVIIANVDSTNKYAMHMVHSDMAVNGNAYFAVEQTQGKGRRGKSWQSKKGENIIISIVADVGFLSIHNQFQLSASVALGCLDFFKMFIEENIKIKWPNDLFWNDRKAGGILIENIIKGDVWQWAVIGVGLNINQTQFPSGFDYKPVSLKQITEKDFDIIESGKILHGLILKRIEDLKKNGYKKIFEEYNNALFRMNEKVKLRKGNIVFETVITGVSLQGQLLTADSIERSFSFDEVEWVLG